MKIALKIENIQEQHQIEQWIKHHINTRYISVPYDQESNVCFVEVNQLFDWVKIKRMKKQHPNCFIIPIVNNQLSHSAPLAIDIGLPYLLVKPFQKKKVMRAIKKAEELFDQHTVIEKDRHQVMLNEHQIPFQDAFLRRLLKGDITEEKELLEAHHLLGHTVIPNTILFIQGFTRSDTPNSFHGSNIIKEVIKAHFAPLQRVTFIHFNHYLLLLVKVPDGYSSFKKWDDGTKALERAINQLIEAHQTYIYLGIGNTFSKPLDLYKSFDQAREARRKPPVASIHIRYYEDLTPMNIVLEAIEYIEQHCHEQIVITDVAKYINFSPTHFGRIFKKETRRKFPEYVALTRIIMSLPSLRHSSATMEKIAADFGFNTPNYYSSIFKKFVGLTPSEYRNTREIYFK